MYTRSNPVTLILLVASLPVSAQDDPCPNPQHPEDAVTDDFSFIASSDRGVVGDVVGIDISLLSSNPRNEKDLSGMNLILSYDAAHVELIADPQYTEEFDRLAISARAREIVQAEGTLTAFNGTPTTKGLAIGSTFQRAVAAELFVDNAIPAHLMTLYFRIRGPVDTRVLVNFNPFIDSNGKCLRSSLTYSSARTDPNPLPLSYVYSTKHVDGIIRVVDGEITRPEPPPLPPNANVYSEAPTAEQAQIIFELTGAVVQPLATNVPLDFYITSSYEYAGYAVSLRYPSEYLEIASINEHTRPAALQIDNNAGHLVMYMNNSRRRLATEGQKLKIATLYFTLKEAASAQAEIVPAFGEYKGYVNWLNIYSEGSVINDRILPVSSQVSPVTLDPGVLKVQSGAIAPGDVNADKMLDLSDVVVLLSSLFLGEVSILCPEAAEYNNDGIVDVADAVAMLNHLFLGAAAAPEKDIFCNQ